MEYHIPPTIREELMRTIRETNFSSNSPELDDLVPAQFVPEPIDFRNSRKSNIKILIRNYEFLKMHHIKFTDDMSDENLDNLVKLVKIATKNELLQEELKNMEHSVNILYAIFHQNKKPKKRLGCHIL